LHESPLVPNARTINEGPNLTAPKPTAYYEENDWQTEANAQNPNIDLRKTFFNEERKYRGVNRNQITEGDG
jgi:hypothetical protein